MNFIEEKILEKNKLNELAFRFPPENNGFLHMGHAKSICLNFGLGEKYKSPCYLRFDDTNPSNESDEYTKSIINDIDWLGFKPTKIKFTSDYFDFLYFSAKVLIKKGLAYVDDSSSEDIAALKGTPEKHGVNSPFRNRTIDHNLKLFESMRKGFFKEGSCTLRAKIDMASPNMLLRDPIIYRIINTYHHHVGDKWKIYPMYDFAHPLSDYLEKISDSLCTLEFESHRPLYNWVLENCDLTDRLPEQTEFARLNIDYTILSKRNLKRLVEEGYVSGWNDPRMPTISGMRRKGFTPESIRDFCERISVTRADGVVSYALLEECLRNDLNKRGKRLMGVMDPIKLNITNWKKGETEWVDVENNPEDPDAGKRSVPFSGELWIEREDFNVMPDKKYHRLKLGGEVRLKGAYVVKATSVSLNSDGTIKEVNCEYDPLTRSGMIVERKIKGTIHWVSVPHAVNIEVREYDRLFTVPDPGKAEDITSVLNPNSLTINKSAYFEPDSLLCKSGVPVQMMRKGYYVLDEDGVAFNKTVSLKEGWKIPTLTRMSDES